MRSSFSLHGFWNQAEACKNSEPIMSFREDTNFNQFVLNVWNGMLLDLFKIFNEQTNQIGYVKSEVADVRSEVKTEINEVKVEIAKVHDTISQILAKLNEQSLYNN